MELQRLAFALPEDELSEALELLRAARPGGELGPVVAAVAARWAEFNPAEALRMTRALPKALHASVWSGALRVWAGRDFNAAFAWTCRQPDGKDRDAQLDIVYHDLMKRDPAAALARLQEVPTEAKRKQYRSWTLEVWRHADPEAALAWLVTNEPEETRDNRIHEFIHDWSTTRPDLAVSYALKHVTNPHQREDTVRFALMQWGMHDPAAAIATLVNLPPELQTASLANNAAPFIATGDTAALLEATRQLPAGEFRDALQASVVPRLAATDLEQAREIAAGIQSPQSRRRAAMGIGRQWLQQDAAAARQWTEASSDLSADSKKHLLEDSTK
jgi:hypothetical protein